MLATFAALLWVLFGYVCPLYDQIYKLWRVLNHPSIKSVKSKFTRIRYAHIVGHNATGHNLRGHNPNEIGRASCIVIDGDPKNDTRN